MLRVFRRFGSIQFDPIAVAGRNHDLMLHARVAGYDPAWCDLLYERREIFEAYNKGLSFVPTSEFPWFHVTASRSASQTVAENRGIKLHSVTSTVEGAHDIRGILGADSDVRNGFNDIKVTFTIDADASREDIEALVAQSQKRSAVYDALTNPTNVTVEVD